VDERTQAVRPFAEVVRSGVVMPAGADYADEMDVRGALVQGPDDVSAAVGEAVYEENRGFPWARRAPALAGTPGEPVTFGRHFPRSRTLVDVWPDRANCTPERRADLQEESEFKFNLAARNGYAYFSIHNGDPLDAREVAAARARAEQLAKWWAEQGQEVEAEPDRSAEVVQTLDEVSEAVGSAAYVANYHPEWAVSGPAGRMEDHPEWAAVPNQERYTFSRWYWQAGTLADMLPHPSKLGPVARERQYTLIGVKKALAEANGVNYRVFWRNPDPAVNAAEAGVPSDGVLVV